MTGATGNVGNALPRLVLLDGQDVVVVDDPQTECAPGSSPCFYAPFGLSADGDGVFVLDGDTIIASAELPGSGVSDQESYCRSPHGTGDFEACDPTPGAPNP